MTEPMAAQQAVRSFEEWLKASYPDQYEAYKHEPAPWNFEAAIYRAQTVSMKATWHARDAEVERLTAERDAAIKLALDTRENLVIVRMQDYMDLTGPEAAYKLYSLWQDALHKPHTAHPENAQIRELREMVRILVSDLDSAIGRLNGREWSADLRDTLARATKLLQPPSPDSQPTPTEGDE